MWIIIRKSYYYVYLEQIILNKSNYHRIKNVLTVLYSLKNDINELTDYQYEVLFIYLFRIIKMNVY